MFQPRSTHSVNRLTSHAFQTLLSLAHQLQRCCRYATQSLPIVLAMAFCPRAFAVDLFAGAKAEIIDSVGSDSSIYFAMLVVGLLAAGIAGFLTRNWAAAIGSFVAGVIFINVAMSFIGL